MRISPHDASMFTHFWHEEGEQVADWLQHAPDDADIRAVLSVTTSLTVFLEQVYGMPLQVQLHKQCGDVMEAQEADILGMEVGIPVLRRHVSLCFHGQVMFDAESILPVQGVSEALLQELEAGVRPLANLLQEHGLSLSRSDLTVLHGDDGWGRRSVLRSALGTQALVLEQFRPEFWTCLRSLQA